MLRLIALCLFFAGPAVAAPTAKAPPAPVEEAWDRTAPHAGEAWIRAAAVPGRPAAGYLVVTGGGQPDALVRVASPGLRVEMHRMAMDRGVMRMEALRSLPVPAGQRVAFAPGGGDHLMIFGMTGTPRSVPMTLKFRSGRTVDVVAEVRAPGAAAPDPHAGHGAH